MNRKNKSQKFNSKAVEKDALYALKLILFFILGCMWIRLGGSDGTPLPVGLVFGILFASHDHFQIDKKIEFAILLVAAILSFVAPIGFVLDIQ